MAWLKVGAGESERGDKLECEISLACLLAYEKILFVPHLGMFE